eukprot:TRINITY_DN2122_c0_g3_i1.p1 TRINITY_DN2122_c0_g3~~TRINITY_DN2122_c0_g3_i1.p1  ORF type:complete len:271 (+),score=40.88 TRINITY_DN2122_c0_g3_i1:54-866(+)
MAWCLKRDTFGVLVFCLAAFFPTIQGFRAFDESSLASTHQLAQHQAPEECLPGKAKHKVQEVTCLSSCLGLSSNASEAETKGWGDMSYESIGWLNSNLRERKHPPSVCAQVMRILKDMRTYPKIDADTSVWVARSSTLEGEPPELGDVLEWRTFTQAFSHRIDAARNLPTQSKGILYKIDLMNGGQARVLGARVMQQDEFLLPPGTHVELYNIEPDLKISQQSFGDNEDEKVEIIVDIYNMREVPGAYWEDLNLKDEECACPVPDEASKA